MPHIRLEVALIAGAIAFATIGLPGASASGLVRGEPRFHAALPMVATPARHGLSASQLALIRIAAHTDDPAVVAQVLDDHRSEATQPTTAAQLRAGHALDWGWVSALVLAAIAALGTAAYALSRRATRHIRPAPQP